MKVQFTLTTESPAYCLGLWDGREEAEAFMNDNGITGEGLAVTPIFIA